MPARIETIWSQEKFQQIGILWATYLRQFVIPQNGMKSEAAVGGIL